MAYLSTNFPDCCFTELMSYDKINILVGDYFYPINPNVCKHVDTFSKNILSEKNIYSQGLVLSFYKTKVTVISKC